ncbi:MAG TPA: deoxyribodipyrimidine photo-lyase, partial [Acidimicrobiia bacterium]|nr:deoxyribodipyrimidine photo-lyase [Acidimicrobiia bacterium]
METAVVAFTRDLRVRDHPALRAAIDGAHHVVPLFVIDDHLVAGPHASPNRLGFLGESLRDLDDSLRRVGGRLVVRRGDWVSEVVRVVAETGAGAVHVSADVSQWATRRRERLARTCASSGCAVVEHPGVTVVPPGALRPAGGGEFKVFTPYHRRWLEHPWRPVLPAPRRVELPPALVDLTGDERSLDALDALDVGGRSPDVEPGGESAATARLQRWARGGLARYGERH